MKFCVLILEWYRNRSLVEYNISLFYCVGELFCLFCCESSPTASPSCSYCDSLYRLRVVYSYSICSCRVDKRITATIYEKNAVTYRECMICFLWLELPSVHEEGIDWDTRSCCDIDIIPSNLFKSR